MNHIIKNENDKSTFLFTSESVGEGHPGEYFFRQKILNKLYKKKFIIDKLCDQISDAILDAHLEQDPEARVACGNLTS